MSFQRVHQFRSQNSQTSSSTSQVAPRPFPVQEPKRIPTQEELENQAFQQNKFEATGLQLKKKYGTITPVEQERLGVLQAKVDDFWAQRLERASRFGHNFANVPVHAPGEQVSAPIQPQFVPRLSRASVSPLIQAKLTIGQVNDKYEQEADWIAEQVLSMAPPTTPNIQQQTKDEQEEIQTKPLVETITPIVQRQEVLEEDEPIQAKCESCEEKEQVQRSPDGVPQVQADLESRLNASKGGGNPLSDEVRSFMEPRFEADFSHVRVHTDGESVQMSRELGAQAFTHGSHIYYGTGKAPAKDELTGHELTHVVQQGHSYTSSIQRQIVPEDVASEMVGRSFKITDDFSVGGVNLKTGDKVTIVAWSNTAETVEVTHPSGKGKIQVPKRFLQPVSTTVSGINPYSAGVTGQSDAVEKAEKKLTDWMGQKASFKGAKAVARFDEERKRRADLLATKREVLNRKLIQETMFNRFDSIIKKEVDAANTAHGLKGKAALDPNLVKAMLFQESQLGTSGTHLEVPPSHPVKSRFNLGQVIDSSGLALLTLFEKEQPAILSSFFLTNLRSDLVAAQAERAKLQEKQKTKPLTAAEATRLSQLNALSVQSWERFIWSYTAPGKSVGFNDAVNSFFSATTPARNLDYEFWIHMAVFWLFEKHKSGMSWTETIKAYNGSGARADQYRKAVVNRAASAATAAKAGKEFIPGAI